MKKTFIIIFCLGLSGLAFSQDLNTHYLYQLNWFNINPAYTGQTDGIKAIINPGTQWTGLEGSPTNSMLGLHGGLGEHMGLGSKLVIDKRGIFNSLTMEMTYAYKVILDERNRLNFGVSVGMFQTFIDQNTILIDQYTDSEDPTITSSYYNETRFLGSFGALYQFDNLEVGFSVPHLVVSGKPVSDHIFGTAKYDFFTADDKLKLSPLLVYQNLTRSPNQLDVGIKGEWDELAWVQVAYRTNKTVATALGVNIKNCNLGYLFNINNAPLNIISSGSHEVYISFKFNKGNNRRLHQKIETNPTSFDSQRLKKDLSEVKTIQKSDHVSPELMNELKEIQSELSGLMHKIKTGDHTEEDDKRILQIEQRITELKRTHSDQ